MILNKKEAESRLPSNSNWTFENNSIEKEFTFSDFSNSVAFIVKVGIEAEKADHHPDILLHSWNKVKITLSTHSEGGITEKDINLAEKIEKL